MKYLKTYEYVRNTKYSTSLVNDLIKAIESIDKWSYVKDIHNQGNQFGEFWFDVNPKFEKQILKLLPKFVYKASRMGLMFYTNYNGGREFSGIIKEPKLKRVKPTKYIYHLTPEENVEYILENGLTTEMSDSDNWGDELFYPNSIFASMEGDKFGVKSGDDVMLRIDTTSLKNKWWVDLNFYSPIVNTLFRDFIMTFEDIPGEYISIAEE